MLLLKIGLFIDKDSSMYENMNVKLRDINNRNIQCSKILVNFRKLKTYLGDTSMKQVAR